MFYIKSEDQREMKHKVQRETLLTVCTEVVRNKVFKHDGFWGVYLFSHFDF